jgi:hypothetical protein
MDPPQNDKRAYFEPVRQSFDFNPQLVCFISDFRQGS